VNADSDPRLCPYVGLEPFEKAHEDYFFGRQLDSKVLADHVGSRPITVLYGASGVGKSSLINVGLPAALSKTVKPLPEGGDQTDAPPNWIIVSLREWQNPQRLTQTFIEAVIQAISVDHRPPPGVRGYVTLSAVSEAIHNTRQPVLLIFDQFEEYFLYREPEATREFESYIGALASRRDLPAHILFTLREDGLHLLDQLRAYIPSIMETTIELGPLDDQAVAQAIQEPVKHYNKVHRKNRNPIIVEDELVSVLIHQLKEADTSLVPRAGLRKDQRFVELPYLQLVLFKLWAEEGGSEASSLRRATLTDPEKLGGVRKIVEDHVDAVMRQLSPDDKEFCFAIFNLLVTPIGSKIAYPTAGLAVGQGVSEERVKAVLKKLTPKEARILKPVNVNGLEGFEIFHDVLGPAVLNWTHSYGQGSAVEMVAPTAPAFPAGPLPYSTVCYELRNRPGLFVGYKTGPLDNVQGASIWVNSENTDMLMDRVVGRSISSRIRLLGSMRDDDGNIVEDTIAQNLRNAVGRRGHVRIGTVLVTGSGSLKERGVERILHVATVQPQTSQGGGVRANLNTLVSCITAVLDRAEMINKEYWTIARNIVKEWCGLKSQYCESILIPIIGAGEGGLSVEDVTNSIIPAAIERLGAVQSPTLKKVFFLAFDARSKAACDAVIEKATADGKLVGKDGE
jgi:O-acetyl-ADP-ribose deacetylase (regulator of RNase III)